MESFLISLGGALAPTIATIVAGLVSWMAVEATKYVRAKTRSGAANDAVSHICNTVETVVANLNQTMVPALQEATKDGKLTKANGEILKTIAVQAIQSQIPAAVERSAKLAVNSVNDLISAKIEQAVGKQKR